MRRLLPTDKQTAQSLSTVGSKPEALDHGRSGDNTNTDATLRPTRKISLNEVAEHLHEATQLFYSTTYSSTISPDFQKILDLDSWRSKSRMVSRSSSQPLRRCHYGELNCVFMAWILGQMMYCSRRRAYMV